MRKLPLILIFLLTVSTAWAQMDKPKSVKLTASKSKAEKGEIVELTLTVVPMDHFHVYGLQTTCPPDVGQPLAEITFSGQNFTLVGKPYGVGHQMQTDDLAAFDKIDCKVAVFPGNGVFKQKIRIDGPVKNLKCNFYGQMCDDSRCVRINEDVNLATGIEIAETPEEAVPSDTATLLPNDIDTSMGAVIPKKATKEHSYKSKSKDDIGKCEQLTYTGNLGAGKNDTDNKNLWAVFLLALTSGLIALLTPCVFPMIPMTVSFFIKNNDRQKAIRDGLVFAFAIIAIYVIIGTLFASLFGAGFANFMATHWAPNVFFFIIFVVFAASFFGAFEIVLPSSWVNAMDKRADRGGFAGPIFMAATIALVSFSCTGPIVGTVLVESAKGGLITPIVAMFGFSLAFALPFGLLVIFPSYLQNLPKSGGWLNSVKVVLGFIELAFALKFLSTADQTYHWHILDREVFLALWIIIFTLLGIYLLGKIKFSHDSDLPFLTVPRLFLAIITLSFVAYLVPGMWGAPLKALAGYLPPMGTQDFDVRRIANEAAGIEELTCAEPKYEDQLHLPHGLKGYFDYEQALACAKEQNKPLFIDFTGHGCVNCRRMEEKVWSDPAVLKILKNDYVVVSLYVDDKVIQLDEKEHFIAKSSGKKITKLGDKNTEIQTCYFNSNSQPMYVLMNSEETLLQNPGSAETFKYDPLKFVEFLKNGIKEFNTVPVIK
ncbi:MAG: thioredoxin family protein [Bacteroidia bacterium]|nr:thioredoxin family protein [Bacteroidia bacterium]